MNKPKMKRIINDIIVILIISSWGVGALFLMRVAGLL